MTGLRMIAIVIGAAVFSCPFSAFAQGDQVPLNEREEIITPLRAGAVAREIERSCETITRRSYRVWSEGLSLIFQAKRMGFTRAQIDAFINSAEERSALELYARSAIESYGYDLKNEDQMCELGAQQIAIGSYAGSFLQKSR